MHTSAHRQKSKFDEPVSVPRRHPRTAQFGEVDGVPALQFHPPFGPDFDESAEPQQLRFGRLPAGHRSLSAGRVGRTGEQFSSGWVGTLMSRPSPRRQRHAGSSRVGGLYGA